MVVGISGASGVCYGIRLLEVLAEMGCTTHLVMTEAARKIIEIEIGYEKSSASNQNSVSLPYHSLGIRQKTEREYTNHVVKNLLMKA